MICIKKNYYASLWSDLSEIRVFQFDQFYEENSLQLNRKIIPTYLHKKKLVRVERYKGIYLFLFRCRCAVGKFYYWHKKTLEPTLFSLVTRGQPKFIASPFITVVNHSKTLIVICWPHQTESISHNPNILSAVIIFFRHLQQKITTDSAIVNEIIPLHNTLFYFLISENCNAYFYFFIK